mmetsp:Transcript_40233/g.87093  ORF Transcript_40233/g.87093 Transcript_40233/m.87093 type:complete len:87 (+) Transcript_40233:346-606(+)
MILPNSVATLIRVRVQKLKGNIVAFSAVHSVSVPPVALPSDDEGFMPFRIKKNRALRVLFLNCLQDDVLKPSSLNQQSASPERRGA